MTVHDLLKKAARAAESSRLLLANGDIDGACNRAYYAMFDAAHAALLAGGVTLDPRDLKKHATVIGLFGKRLVNEGIVPKELGRSLNKIEDIRLLADYADADIIESETAAWAVEQATIFVDTIKNLYPRPPAPNSEL